MRIVHFRQMIRGFVVAVVLIGVYAPLWAEQSAIHAQDDDDEEPDTGHIYTSRVEILFPAAIRWVVGVNAVLDQVESVSLIVHQESGLSATFAINPEQYVGQATEAATEFVYLWDLSADPIPTPFEALNFRWEIQTSDGQLSTWADEIIFADTLHGEWESAGQPPLILHWHDEDLGGESMWNEVMAAYSELSQRTGRTPFYQFAIYNPGVRWCDTLPSPDPESEERITVVISREDGTHYPCSREAVQRIYARAGVIFLQRPSIGYTVLQDLLVTTMAKETYADLWQGAPVPSWFTDGLASLYHLRPENVALDLVRAAAREDSLLPLSQLVTSLPDDAIYQEQALWEAESYLLVLYLADLYGAELPFDLALAIPEYSDGFDEALQALTELDQAALWREWVGWLFSETAERAVMWMPYLPTTPTPTATATATSRPSTPTPSNTPVDTPTATSTSLADRPPTVVQIRTTPTLATPQRATNTPLPPGSLPTATPRSPTPSPTPDDNATDNNKVIQGVVALVAGILFLVSLWGIFLWQRRR